MLDLGKKGRKQVVDIEGSRDEGGNMSAIPKLSREALMELIRTQKKKKSVSYPKNKYNKSHSNPSEFGDEESSSDLISSDSYSNSSYESSSGQDATDKG